MPGELDFGYEMPLLLDLIADLQWPPAKESENTIQGCKFVKSLQRIKEVARDELHDDRVEQKAEANLSRQPIDSTIPASVMVFLGTQDLPLPYANINPTWDKLVHLYIGPDEILQICGYVIEIHLRNNMLICDTVIVSRCKIDHTDNCRVCWLPPPLPAGTRCAGRSYVVESVANHRHSSEGTSWEDLVKWEDWDKKDNRWELDKNMTKAKEMVKQYWKEIGERLKVQRNVPKKVAWEESFYLDGWVTSWRHDCFLSGCCISLRGFSMMIGEGSDVGGWLRSR